MNINNFRYIRNCDLFSSEQRSAYDLESFVFSSLRFDCAVEFVSTLYNKFAHYGNKYEIYSSLSMC
jgi:hypothetical protein